MQPDHSHPDDPRLGEVLQEWKSVRALPPRFQEQVWRRIERSPKRTAPASVFAGILLNWITNAVPRPAFATFYVAVLLALGAAAGWTQARRETAETTSRLSALYVRSVDPYLGDR